METKIFRNSFAGINCSKEATEYFRKYIKNSKYDLDQLAYNDSEYNLFEWGYRDIDCGNRWFLYDFVAFEKGYRGNKDHIIEIIEYHGPFHYTADDVTMRGHEKAYPWKSKNTTIKESKVIDDMKEKLALKFTNNYKIIWARDLLTT